MTADLRLWLAERLAGAPPALAQAVTAALPASACTLPDVEAAAERLMRDAQATVSTRAGALTLLAADALTTLAQEYRASSPAPGSRLPAPGSRD